MEFAQINLKLSPSEPCSLSRKFDMIKLFLILLGSLVAFYILPETLAAIAGVVFIGAFFALLISGLGSLFSAFGSVVSTIFGAILSILAALVVLVVLGVGLPVLLVIAIPVGLLFLCGCMFCTLLCGVV